MLQVRPIDHETGSHGVPGIYFKYDMSALKVIVNQARKISIFLSIRWPNRILPSKLIFFYSAIYPLSCNVLRRLFAKVSRTCLGSR